MTSTYLLNISLERPQTIEIGGLGKFLFEDGNYIYVGSAKKNLHHRIVRHLKKKKKMHWHIDYLLRKARVTDVWTCNLPEETVADILMRKMESPVPRFGASDKKSKSHLFFGELQRDLPGTALVEIPITRHP